MQGMVGEEGGCGPRKDAGVLCCALIASALLWRSNLSGIQASVPAIGAPEQFPSGSAGWEPSAISVTPLTQVQATVRAEAQARQLDAELAAERAQRQRLESMVQQLGAQHNNEQ